MEALFTNPTPANNDISRGKDLPSDLVFAMVHCEASIWRLIDFPRHALRRHDHRTIMRPRRELHLGGTAYADGFIYLDLSSIVR